MSHYLRQRQRKQKTFSAPPSPPPVKKQSQTGYRGRIPNDLVQKILERYGK